MDFLYSVFLGLVQGLSEFLPISSSGHLSILQQVFGLQNADITFDVLLHLGTLVAVFAAFWSDICDLWRDFLALFKRSKRPGGGDHRPGQRMILMIIIATIPLILVMPVKPFIEGLFSQPIFVGSMLILTGILLFLADAIPRGHKTDRNITPVDALIVGVMQTIAVVPGLSRSGSTIAAGIFCGFDRKFAVRFSFLMSIPAVLGANVVSLIDAVKEGFDFSKMPVYLAGMVVAGVSGYFAIKLIRYIADKGKFGGFATYCVIVGALTIVYFMFIQPMLGK